MVAFDHEDAVRPNDAVLVDAPPLRVDFRPHSDKVSVQVFVDVHAGFVAWSDRYAHRLVFVAQYSKASIAIGTTSRVKSHRSGHRPVRTCFASHLSMGNDSDISAEQSMACLWYCTDVLALV